MRTSAPLKTRTERDKWSHILNLPPLPPPAAGFNEETGWDNTAADDASDDAWELQMLIDENEARRDEELMGLAYDA